MTQVINEDTGRLAIACDYCGNVIEDLNQVVDHGGSEYCPKCHFEQTVSEWAGKLTEQVIRVNMESKYTARLNYTGSCHVIDVDVLEGEELVAHTWINLRGEDAPKKLEDSVMALGFIAVTNKLDHLKMGSYAGVPTAELEVLSA